MKRPHQVVRGIITKIDHPDADPARAARILGSLGVRPPYIRVSALTGEGLNALRALPEVRRALESGA